MNEDLLTRHFSHFGNVEDCVIKQYNLSVNPHRQSGYGFVYYRTEEEALGAIHAVKNSIIDGIKFDCGFSREYQRSGSNPSVVATRGQLSSPTSVVPLPQTPHGFQGNLHDSVWISPAHSEHILHQLPSNVMPFVHQPQNQYSGSNAARFSPTDEIASVGSLPPLVYVSHSPRQQYHGGGIILSPTAAIGHPPLPSPPTPTLGMNSLYHVAMGPSLIQQHQARNDIGNRFFVPPISTQFSYVPQLSQSSPQAYSYR